jgi:hypothetical protein
MNHQLVLLHQQVNLELLGPDRSSVMERRVCALFLAVCLLCLRAGVFFAFFHG